MRWFLIIAGVLVLIIGIPFAGMSAYFWRFYSPIPAAEYDEPQNAAEARQQDLDYLTRLTEFDRSFSEAELELFQAYVAQLQNQAETLTEAEFFMGVAAAAAISENGHTNLYFRSTLNRLNSLPVRFFWFGDGLYIVRTHANHEDLLGARVIAYEGTAPEHVVTQLDPYYGGNDAALRFDSPLFMASPAAMHAAGIAAAPNQITLTLQYANGTMGERVVEIEANSTDFMRVADHLLATNSEQEEESGNDWRFLEPSGAEVPLYSRHPGSNLWWEPLPDDGVYIRMRRVYGTATDGTPINDWLEGVQSTFQESPADFLVLDLRSNGGGDLTLAMNFARNIADLVVPGGDVFILTDGGTFSAAIVTAAYAVHSAGPRGIIVGEQIGDFEQFWAESGGAFELPNSGLRIAIATGYHDWENGCESFADCYWLSVVVGVAAGPLDPDIDAPMTYADFSRGIDTGLQAVLASR